MEYIKKFHLKNKIFKWVTQSASSIVLLIVLAIFVVLIYESRLAIKEFGVIHFITSTDWDPYRNLFGAAHVLFGTLFITFFALLYAIPLSIGIAIFIAEVVPGKLKQIINTSIEMLAAIPSIIYGMWGLFVLAPIMAEYVEPFLQKTLGTVPGIKIFFEGTPIGIDMFTASIILSIMIIPFIATVTREAFDQVPSVLKESAYGMAATRWEVIKDILIPFIKRNILGGIVLAFGRALGETMAVAFVLGNNHKISFSLLDATATITVTLANEFTEADGDLYLSSLFYLGLILFVLSFALLSLAKYFILRRKEA
ncbi:MAG: phosphate ABC transporter permease subunit PstC [Calditrichaeota bacterium]|nr:MAG: phosphate ABC transporter permease subunit PstC [Calditrichota bacterium]